MKFVSNNLNKRRKMLFHKNQNNFTKSIEFLHAIIPQPQPNIPQMLVKPMISSTYDIFRLTKIATSTKYALKKVSKIVKNRTKNVQNRKKSYQNRKKSFTSRTILLSINKLCGAVASEMRHRFGYLNAKEKAKGMLLHEKGTAQEHRRSAFRRSSSWGMMFKERVCRLGPCRAPTVSVNRQ